MKNKAALQARSQPHILLSLGPSKSFNSRVTNATFNLMYSSTPIKELPHQRDRHTGFVRETTGTTAVVEEYTRVSLWTHLFVFAYTVTVYEKDTVAATLSVVGARILCMKTFLP